MEERVTVSVHEFCHHHQIEISFIQSLHEHGLLQTYTFNDEEWRLPQDQLEQLEKMVRLHYDLQINLEGLEAIHHLLQRVEGLQREVFSLRNRLRLYEEE